MPPTSRPREKLLASGTENLSDAELIALLFGTGTKRYNAVALSETLLRQYPLKKLEKSRLSDWTSIAGIGRSKATRLAAAIELGERIFAPTSLTKTIIQTTADAVSELREYADKKQEYLVALYLNARHELIQREILGMGTLNSLQIEPREIFRPALATPCAALISVDAAGLVSQFILRLIGNTLDAGDSLTFNLRKNGSTQMTLGPYSGSTATGTYTTTTGAFAVAQGDLLTVECAYTALAGSGSISVIGACVVAVKRTIDVWQLGLS